MRRLSGRQEGDSGMRNLRSVNLNLLPILRELIRKQNVTHAARALNMSQPAVSDALSRLRHLLNDQILISDGRKLRLSSYAERIAPQIEDLLGHVESLVCEAPLDMASEEGTIKIATADYVVETFGAKLLRRVAELAPRLTIQFFNFSSESPSQLAAGALDFVFTPAQKLPGTMECVPLFSDDVVCVVPESASFSDSLSYEDFWSARHVAFTPGESVHDSMHSTVLRQLGGREFNAAIVPNMGLLTSAVVATNGIAILPRRLAMRHLEQYPIRLAELPFPFPALMISAYWDPAQSHDGVHRWFQNLLTELSEVALPSTMTDEVADSAAE